MKKKFDKAKQSASRLMVKLKPGRRSRSHSPNAPDPEDDPSMSTSTAPIDSHSYADPKAPPNTISTAGSVVTEFLAAARDGADLCLPLKAALVGAVKILEICERTAKVGDQYKQLGSRLAHLGAVTGTLSQRKHLDPNLRQRLESIAESFSRLAACIEAKQARGTVRRVLESQADVAEVKDLLIKISTRIEAFIFESMIRVEIGVDDILARLPSVEERELEKELTKWNAITQVIEKALDGRRVYDAAHDAQPEDAGCMAGTRVGVLCKFVEWIKNDPKTIFWLAGMAGTGKTSVAVSLCRMLQEDPDVVLGGAFFCSRTTSDEARSDVRRVIPTLAALFAEQSPKFAAELAAELKPNSRSAAYRPISEQIGPLLQRPLVALASETRPIVFVIDALDECSNEHDTSALLKAIVAFTSPTKVKFILTSRSETHILGSPVSNRTQNEILQLHMIGSEEVTEDIRLFIDHAFKQQSLHDPEPWYSEDEIRALAILSNGLFIFASTTIAYILDPDNADDRKARLQTALSAMKNSKVATGPLDEVYEVILTQATSEAKVEPQELARTRQVLACILTARMPLSVRALAELLDLKADLLRSSLRRLRAVVHVPEELDQPGLRTLHASFGDYMFERAASNITIARSLGDEALARGCLRIMAEQLHFNVSQSPSSYDSNPNTKPNSITLSLEYACLEWVYHVSALPESSSFDEVIDLVFCPRVLFWLEVMSVQRQVRRAAAMLLIATTMVHSFQLSRFLRDANSFVASSREAIERSAPHIYISALPFAPKDSLIYQTFLPSCTGLISVDTYGIGRHAGWLVMTLTGHEGGVTSVAYSSDGRLLASGSTDGSVRVWDTRTGEAAMSPLHSGDGAVHSVSISSDSKAIASGTEAGVVCIWTIVASRAALRKLSGHSDQVKSVVFSSQGLLVASASVDKTVRIWNFVTGQVQAVLSNHTNPVLAVSFSPDGQLVAYSSDGNTILLYQVATGRTSSQTLRGHPDLIHSLSFSPDCTALVSGSYMDIRLWNLQTGSSVASLKYPSENITSLQFAPNGRSVVTGALNNSVRFWTVPQPEDNTTTSSMVLGHHENWVSSVKFSPNGLYIVSASGDRSIRIWDAGSGQPMSQPLAGHDNTVYSVAVSSDGTTLVSASGDLSVRAWNAHNGEPKLPPLLGHSYPVLSADISSDGRLIASASADGTVLLWDGITGETIGEPLRTHETRVHAVAFSADARWVAWASGDSTVCVSDVATRQLSEFSPLVCSDAVFTVSFSPDGKLIAAGVRDGYIHVWWSESGRSVCEPLRTYDMVSRPVLSVGFTPDSTHLVSGSEDLTVRIWDMRTRQQVHVLEGHMAPVHSVAYSPDGRFIVSGSADKTIRLWDATNGALVSTLHGHGSTVESVTFMPDMRSIVSCSSDQTIRIWDFEVACSTSFKGSGGVAEALASTELVDGWLQGSSGELLLWVPLNYRNYLCIPPCTSLIARYHVVVEANSLCAGQHWTSCWSDVASTGNL